MNDDECYDAAVTMLRILRAATESVGDDPDRDHSAVGVEGSAGLVVLRCRRGSHIATFDVHLLRDGRLVAHPRPLDEDRFFG